MRLFVTRQEEIYNKFNKSKCRRTDHWKFSHHAEKKLARTPHGGRHAEQLQVTRAAAVQQLGQRVLQRGAPRGVRHHVQLICREDTTHRFAAQSAPAINCFLQPHACESQDMHTRCRARVRSVRSGKRTYDYAAQFLCAQHTTECQLVSLH